MRGGNLMGVYYYYVNAYDGTYTDWIRRGTSPYLNAVDYPANYVYYSGVGIGKRIGIFDFQDSGAEKSETISKVYLELYALSGFDPDVGFPYLAAYIWDGSTWTSFSLPQGETWAWRGVDITSKINSWSKVDGCRLYLYYNGSTSFHYVYADAARLKVETVVPVIAKIAYTDGLVCIA